MALTLVLKSKAHRATRKPVSDSICASSIERCAPSIFPADVNSVISRRVYDGLLKAPKGKAAQAFLDQAPDQIGTHPELRGHAREVADRFNQRMVYDTTYASLVEFFGAESWTADKVFHDAVHRELKFVSYLPDYLRRVPLRKGNRL